jgi:hypothetical protein
VAEVGVDCPCFPARGIGLPGRKSARAAMRVRANGAAGAPGRVTVGCGAAAQAARHAQDRQFPGFALPVFGGTARQEVDLLGRGHSVLKIVYYVLKHGWAYRGLCGSYLDCLGLARLTRYLVQRLERLGHKITLDPDGDPLISQPSPPIEDQEFFKAGRAALRTT